MNISIYSIICVNQKNKISENIFFNFPRINYEKVQTCTFFTVDYFWAHFLGGQTIILVSKMTLLRPCCIKVNYLRPTNFFFFSRNSVIRKLLLLYKFTHDNLKCMEIRFLSYFLSFKIYCRNYARNKCMYFKFRFSYIILLYIWQFLVPC